MSFRLGELAGILGCRLEGDSEWIVEGVQTLENAGPEHLSFVTNRKYRRKAESSEAGAMLVPEGFELPGRNLLIAKNPYFELTRAVGLFHPAEDPRSGIHASAVVDESAKVHPSAWVGPGVVLEPGVEVAEGVQLHPYVVLGRNCDVGGSSILHANVVAYPETIIGKRCIVHSGVVLGCDGFGFATESGAHEKLPQVGTLKVDDDVEIGANCAVDRGTLGETRIGADTKIDNLVHLAHNVSTGRGCFLVAQSGIAGSTKLGNYVVVAGQAGVAGHLEIGDQVQVAAKSAVFKSVDEGTVGGIPAVEMGRWRKQVALVARLEKLQRRVSKLERDSSEEENEGE